MGIGWFGWLLMLAIFFVQLFLILIVLVQRGRGGGLAGALGGMGGQSAFGAKAGDVFTRVTIVTAAIWIFLCWASLEYFNSRREGLGGTLGGQADTVNQESDPAAGPASDPLGGAGGETPDGEPSLGGAATAPDPGEPNAESPGAEEPAAEEPTPEADE